MFKRVNKNICLEFSCPFFSSRKKSPLNKTLISPQHYYLLTRHEVGFISYTLQEVIMGFKIYADLRPPFREVLKLLEGSEWRYAIF